VCSSDLLGDLKRVAKDWMAALWMLVMPLIFAYIFGSAFRGGGQQATWIPVIDLDRSDLSGLFIEQMREDGYYIDVKGPESEMELKKNWPYGVVIPAGFGEKTLKGQASKLSVVQGNGPPERILEVQACLTRAIVRFTKALVLADTSNHAWNKEAKESLKEILARPAILTLSRKSDSSLRPPPSGFNLSLPGFLIMFVMQMVITYGGVTLVNDRNGGRLTRLLGTPTHAYEVYLGKVLSRILLALLQSILLLASGSLLFKVPLGDHPLFLLPVILSFAAFAGCASILGGVLCQVEKHVVQVAIFASMILSALGGCWWPIEIVPDIFKTIAKITPSYWGLHGIQNVMYFGKSYSVFSMECPILLACAGLALVIALPIARRSRTK
jgi:ABC-2 type transport system permease protein